jgi:antitoxin CcdA
MKADFNLAARKRPVNLWLNEDLVSQAKMMTANLSSVVESLLTEFVIRERRARLTKAGAIKTTVDMWNQFHTQSGSFADEYSTL